MEGKKIIEALKMQPLTEEEKSKRHILGRLYGAIATCRESTRNGRKYNKDLWEKALTDELFKEKIDNKSLFLELGHPTDRDETDMEKVCACIPEMPKIVNGDLYAYVDILDTANGRLLKTLCDYGFVPGISSRGTGDVLDNDEVDPETFYLETWDIVQLPAVKGARLSMTEGLHKPLSVALKESLNKASDSEKKVMEEALEDLDITIDDEENSDSIEDKDEKKNDEEKTNVADDDGTQELIKVIQESLNEKVKLEETVAELQKKLAVSDAKVDSINEELIKYKETTIRLSTALRKTKGLQEHAKSLEEQLNSSKDTITNLNKKNVELTRMNRSIEHDKEKINESAVAHNETIDKLNENLKSQKTLTEKYVKENKELQTKLTEAQEMGEKSKRLCEGYKKLANDTINKYIETKATMIGVKPSDIKCKLSNKYTLDEVDSVCESLQSMELNFGKLPFTVGKGTRITMTESKRDNLGSVGMPRELSEDDVDSTLLTLAGIPTR